MRGAVNCLGVMCPAAWASVTAQQGRCRLSHRCIGAARDLTLRSLGSIVSGHPEIGAHLEVVLAAVRRPDVWHPGHKQQEQWFYLRDAGPSRWLKVVVLYDHDKGSIVTAFARRRMP